MAPLFRGLGFAMVFYSGEYTLTPIYNSLTDIFSSYCRYILQHDHRLFILLLICIVYKRAPMVKM